MPRFPVPSTLPGLPSVLQNKTHDQTGRLVAASYAFDGTLFELVGDEHAGLLTVVAAAGRPPSDQDFDAIAQFAPWPAITTRDLAVHPTTTPDTWAAQAVNALIMPGYRLSNALYDFAREYLAFDGRRLAPSDNIQPDGKKLWAIFDPAIKMTTRLPYYPADDWPDLSGLPSAGTASPSSSSSSAATPPSSTPNP